MSWLLAYLLFLITAILLGWVTFKEGATWKSRIRGWALSLLPVAIFFWDYPVVYFQHVKDCKTDGGLKVFIKPERAEKVRLDGSYYGEGEAQYVLQKFYPYLKLVEAAEEMIKPNSYYAYSVNSVPKDPPGVWGAFATPWKFNKVSLQGLDSDIYIITKYREDTTSKNIRSKYEWKLTRNGKVYAKLTKFTHNWSGIQYPDAVPFWTCPDSDRNSGPEDELLKLILK